MVFVVFWTSLAILAYVYVGYPLLLLAFRGREVGSSGSTPGGEFQPQVTMVISAYNEESVIAQKIQNALALDYPPANLSIIVVSDCSDDRTDEIVKSFDSERVQLLRMEERSGKSIGLNRAVKNTKADLLLFTDANAMFAVDSVQHMVHHFQNPKVGVVTGQQRYEQSDTEEDPTQEGLYWRFESALKALESANGNLVGGDGAIMAIRRALFFDLEEDDLSDYLLPMKIAMQGYRNVYEASAYCTEEAAGSYEKEYKRKVRIVNRAWRATMKCASVLNIAKYRMLSVCVWSHKVLRWLTAIWMGLFAVASIATFTDGLLYQFAVYGQIAFYILVLLGYVFRQKLSSGILTVPYYFCSVNFAALQGIFEHYRGKTYATWNTPRTTPP